jgi:hypothetical protein
LSRFFKRSIVKKPDGGYAYATGDPCHNQDKEEDSFLDRHGSSLRQVKPGALSGGAIRPQSKQRSIR